ncbi:MAG: hypothetical protein KatS3mg011_0982 [Acidimicrobiia bacterium]|nr:MAG: hypothetical protein KatS3mg011_0982 [Acidimicrobiia bacterium]
MLRGGLWEPGPPLKRARGGFGGAWIGGRTCVAGGEEPRGTIGTVECLEGDEWQVVGEMALARHGLAVVALGDRLHLIAGGDRPGLTVTGFHEVVAVP